MIRPRQPMCTIADTTFHQALTVITKSAAPHTIERHYHESVHAGGRTSCGVDYTVTAVLTALLVRFLMGRPYSLRGAMDTIGELSPRQLDAVGMTKQDCTVIHEDSSREYKRFHRFWAARMQPLDPDWDLPSRRLTNSEFNERRAARTPKDLQRSQQADERLTTVINDLLYGSVRHPRAAGYAGDLVVDETIINTANPGGVLGAAGNRYRGASSIAASWARDKDRKLVATATDRAQLTIRTVLSDFGFGVGASFLSAVGQRDALHAVPALFVGLAVHAPTGASIAGLSTAIAHSWRTGLSARHTGRTRPPLLTADMGYNNKSGFGELMIATGYSPVVRYPKHWNISYPSANPAGTPDRPAPGPLQYAGAFYCPAVAERIRGHRTPKTEELLQRDQFRIHDRRLRAIYPFLMGRHSRPAFADIRIGRPRTAVQAPKGVKIRLVCPAAMGTVRCPLKPESMAIETPGLPLAQPDWPAQTLTCCMKSSVTVTLTDDQLRLLQEDLVPGSWEHTLYFEAARAFTEQRFSQLKSKYVAGIADLKTGPRRTPMIKIAIALAAVTVNLIAQQNHDPKRLRAESIDIRERQLAADLGYPPARIPPRS